MLCNPKCVFKVKLISRCNEVELIWAQVKGSIARHNTSFTTTDMIPLIKDGFAQVSVQDWTNRCRHVMEIEDKYQYKTGRIAVGM